MIHINQLTMEENIFSMMPSHQERPSSYGTALYKDEYPIYSYCYSEEAGVVTSQRENPIFLKNVETLTPSEGKGSE